MTPCLRLTPHRGRPRLTAGCARLLLALAVLPPVPCALTVYGAPRAYAASPAERPPGRGHQAGRAHPAHGRPVREGPEETGRPGHGRPSQDSPDAGPPGSGEPSHAVSASASGSAHPSGPAGQPSRAGSRAGEGRMRPGRPDDPAAEAEDEEAAPTGDFDAVRPEEPEIAEVPGVTPSASQPPDEAGLDPARLPAQPDDRQQAQRGEAAPSEPVLQILPLGSGLVLMGLGLGLALLAFRIRRT
ncbi:hypothetical protein NX794_11190 [Streptomyces sp. LP11]|uniref:Secreted protein n=1 Tax=Streptomyces pyxinicus TaxID=2970331 RepID=A0ABT2AZT4_9ACTN|nr:hypothetical protein [Streptomyces sp. LP11]MCS0601774.1 hypothetical protein [Streptomyces sp. LP11]